jgi:hypothetical protein
MKGVLPWLVHWTCRAGARDFHSVLAALVSPDQNISFLVVHYFNAFVPINQQAGQTPCWVGCLLVCVSGLS